MSVFVRGHIPGFSASGSSSSHDHRSKNASKKGDEEKGFLEKAGEALKELIGPLALGAGIIFMMTFRPGRGDDDNGEVDPDRSVSLDELRGWAKQQVNNAMHTLRQDKESLPPDQRIQILERTYRIYNLVQKQLGEQQEWIATDKELSRFYHMARGGVAHATTELGKLGMGPPQLEEDEPTAAVPLGNQPAAQRVSQQTIAYGADQASFIMGKIATGPTVLADPTAAPAQQPPPRRQEVPTQALSAPPINQAGKHQAVTVADARPSTEAIPPEQQNAGLFPQPSQQAQQVGSDTDWSAMLDQPPGFVHAQQAVVPPAQPQQPPQPQQAEVTDWNALAESAPTAAPRHAQIMTAVPQREAPQLALQQLEGISRWRLFKMFLAGPNEMRQSLMLYLQIEEALTMRIQNLGAVLAIIEQRTATIEQRTASAQDQIRDLTETSGNPQAPSLLDRLLNFNTSHLRPIKGASEELLKKGQDVADALTEAWRQRTQIIQNLRRDLNDVKQEAVDKVYEEAPKAAKSAVANEMGTVRGELAGMRQEVIETRKAEEQYAKEYKEGVQHMGNMWIAAFRHYGEPTHVQLIHEKKDMLTELEAWHKGHGKLIGRYEERLRQEIDQLRGDHEQRRLDNEGWIRDITQLKDTVISNLNGLERAIVQAVQNAEPTALELVRVKIEELSGVLERQYFETMPEDMKNKAWDKLKPELDRLQGLIDSVVGIAEGKLAELRQLDSEIAQAEMTLRSEAHTTEQGLRGTYESLKGLVETEVGKLEGAQLGFVAEYRGNVEQVDKERAQQEQEQYEALLKKREERLEKKWSMVFTQRTRSLEGLIALVAELTQLKECLEEMVRAQLGQARQAEEFMRGFEGRTKISSKVLEVLRGQEGQVRKALYHDARIAKTIHEGLKLPLPDGQDPISALETVTQAVSEQVVAEMNKPEGPLGRSSGRFSAIADMSQRLQSMKVEARRSGEMAAVKPEEVESIIIADEEMAAAAERAEAAKTRGPPPIPAAARKKKTPQPVRIAQFSEPSMRDAALGQLGIALSKTNRNGNRGVLRVFIEELMSLVARSSQGMDNDKHFAQTADAVFGPRVAAMPADQRAQRGHEYVLVDAVARVVYQLSEGSSASVDQVSWIQQALLGEHPIDFESAYFTAQNMDASFAAGMDGSVAAATLLVWANTHVAWNTLDQQLQVPANMDSFQQLAQSDVRMLYFGMQESIKTASHLPHIADIAQRLLGVSGDGAQTIAEQNAGAIAALDAALNARASLAAQTILGHEPYLNALASEMNRTVEGIQAELNDIVYGPTDGSIADRPLEADEVGARAGSADFSSVNLIDMIPLHESDAFSRALGVQKNEKINEGTFQRAYAAIRNVVWLADSVLNVPAPPHGEFSPMSRLLQATASAILGQYGEGLNYKEFAEFINDQNKPGRGYIKYTMTEDRLKSLMSGQQTDRAWAGSTYRNDPISADEAKLMVKVLSKLSGIVKGDERKAFAADIGALASLVYAVDMVQRERLDKQQPLILPELVLQDDAWADVRQRISATVRAVYNMGTSEAQEAWKRALDRFENGARSAVPSGGTTNGSPVNGGTSSPAPGTPAPTTPAPDDGMNAAGIEVVDLTLASDTVRGAMLMGDGIPVHSGLSAPHISSGIYVRPLGLRAPTVRAPNASLRI